MSFTFIFREKYKPYYEGGFRDECFIKWLKESELD